MSFDPNLNPFAAPHIAPPPPEALKWQRKARRKYWWVRWPIAGLSSAFVILLYADITRSFFH